MSIYIKLSTLEYPFYADDIKNNENDFALVEESVMPTAKENQIIIEDKPELSKGKYKQKWVVRDLTQEEINAQKIEIVGFMFKDKSLDKEKAIIELVTLGLTKQEAEVYLSRIR